MVPPMILFLAKSDIVNEFDLQSLKFVQTGVGFEWGCRCEKIASIALRHIGAFRKNPFTLMGSFHREDDIVLIEAICF